MSFLLADQNIVFSILLAFIVGLAVLEGLMMIIGFGVGQFLEGFIPSLDVDAPDIEGTGAVSKLLSWLYVKDLPLIVIVIVFLTIFSTVGLTMQSVLNASVGMMLPAFIGWLPALLLTFPFSRICLLYTSPSPRDKRQSRMPSSA